MADMFIATDDIYIDGQPSYRVGHEVHSDNVALHKLQDKVAKVGTKAAERAADAS